MSDEVIIPTWLTPQAESSTLIDDSTSVFRAAYAAGLAQRVSYAEPRLQVKQTFQSLRAQERGPLLAALKRAKGKFATVRAICGYKLRGSFPQTELFANNDFSNGVTGWSSDAQYSLSAIDHGVRATRAQVSAATDAILQAATVSLGVPYALRFFVNSGRGSPLLIPIDITSNITIGADGTQGGMLGGAGYTSPSAGPHSFGMFSTEGGLAGDFFDVKWASFAQCAQVDNGVNMMLNSSGIGGTNWANANATFAASGVTDPTGATLAISITETATSTVQHESTQFVTVPSTAADYSFSIFVRASNRTWCLVQIVETLGSTFLGVYFNLSTGAFGTTVTQTNWTFISQVAVNYGNGWWRIILTGRKTNAATTLQVAISPATGDNGAIYTGTAASVAITAWLGSLAPSSVPVSAVGTTSTAATGTSQTGNSINIKGLPVSTAGLLLEDDMFEINGELKAAIAPLNSDAAGLGTLFFAPALCRSPADGDGVIMNKPMGKFILAADSTWTNDFGVYANIDITLEAINE